MFFQEMLFDLPPIENKPTEPTGKPRIKVPERKQMKFTISSLDDLIPHDHVARTIWEIVCGLDLSEFLKEIQSVEGGAGRPATDPRVLLGIWILGTTEGIASARTLHRYCHEHNAFIWMLGGHSTNYHTLSDFRNQGGKLENMLTKIVASLIHQKVVSTEHWSQDGMRVRANAGTGSFRREKTLKESLKLANERVKHLKKNAYLESQNLSSREKSARKRAATERAQRCKDALETLKQLKDDIDKRQRSKKEKRESKKKARASTTDPESKNMKMPNGGYNPAYNVQYVTDTTSRIITSVQTVNVGTDSGQMKPMLHQVLERYQQLPSKLSIDGGFFNEKGLREGENLGVEVFMPVPKRTQKKYGLEAPLPNDSTVMHRWVERMETERAKEIYKKRASSAEFSNASTRNKGFYQFKVRGLLKTHATSVVFALAHNFQRIASIIKSGQYISLSFI